MLIMIDNSYYFIVNQNKAKQLKRAKELKPSDKTQFRLKVDVLHL
jgi:hypothetical protein